MQLEIYSVYDQATKAYLRPFYARTRGEAIRSFSEAVNTGDHEFSKHRADYYMVFLGMFDDSDGVFKPVASAERVISAEQCVRHSDVVESLVGKPRGLPM